jgi:hypothetical protein
MMLSGLEPVTIDGNSLFVNIGERTNVTGSKAFARMILSGDFEQAEAARRQNPAESPAESRELRAAHTARGKENSPTLEQWI